jgi:hypothetical protein
MRVFLSHAHEDRDFARQLLQRLRDEGVDVWDPDRELFPGMNWLKEMGRALERADAVVFLFSGAFASSPWGLNEVAYAIGNQKYEGRIVTVKLTPNARMPWILNHLSVVDGTTREAAPTARKIMQKLSPPAAKNRRASQRMIDKSVVRSTRVRTPRKPKPVAKLAK